MNDSLNKGEIVVAPRIHELADWLARSTR